MSTSKDPRNNYSPNQSREPSSKNIQSWITSSSSHCVICSLLHFPSETSVDWFNINFQIYLTVSKVVSWLFSKTQPGKSSVQGFYGLQLRRHCNTAGVTQTTILISFCVQANMNCTTVRDLGSGFDFPLNCPLNTFPGGASTR